MSLGAVPSAARPYERYVQQNQMATPEQRLAAMDDALQHAIGIIRLAETAPPDSGSAVVDALRRNVCPDCGNLGLDAGPRGGAGQNIFCPNCGAGFNVAWPRYIVMAQRINNGRP